MQTWWLMVLGLAAGLCTSLSLVPQVLTSCANIRSTAFGVTVGTLAANGTLISGRDRNTSTISGSLDVLRHLSATRLKSCRGRPRDGRILIADYDGIFWEPILR